MDQSQAIYTISEVARYLQVSEKTVSRMLQDGTIPGFKIANQWRFHQGDIEQWLRDMRTEGDKSARSGIASMLVGELDSFPLSRITSTDLIIPDLQPSTRTETLESLAYPLHSKGIVTDLESFVKGLETREQMMSTGVGGGVALPHLRNPKDLIVERPHIVIGISRKGIEWGSIDRKPVHLFVLPVTGDEIVHLRTLSAIRRMLVIDGIVELFTGAETSDDIMSIILKIETILQYQ